MKRQTKALKYKRMNTRLYRKKSYKGLLLKDLNDVNSLSKDVQKNNIYILFRKNDFKLKLVVNKDDKNLFLSKGYQLIGSRAGTKRELELAKLVAANFYYLEFLRG